MRRLIQPHLQPRMAPEFQPYGLPHLAVIFLTIILPFVLAAIAKSSRSQRAIIIVITSLLIANYAVYLIFIRVHGVTKLATNVADASVDWGMLVVIVAMWTGNQRWFEVAYFWGLGGTLQAVLTPDLRYGFPDWRFISFFTSHCGIHHRCVFF